MANLTVGRFRFGLSSFHLNEFTCEPDTDSTGLDLECTKVTIDLHGIVNSVAIASNKIIEGVPGSAGDPLPTTIVALRDYLMKPRQYIKFEMNNTIVLESPALTELACDVRGGPFPQRASYSQVTGDKTAIMHFRVVTYVSYCGRYLLSNRWTLHDTIGSDTFTTRTISGRACFRKDFLDFDELQADDFRKWLVIPCPNDMRRVQVSVTEAADGASVDYTVTDREVRYGTGANRAPVEISGTVTAGLESNIKTASDAASNIGMGLIDAFKLSASKLMGRVTSALIPNSKFSAIARVKGRKDADQYVLSRIAVAVVLDRLKFIYNPKNGIGCISKLFVTNNIDSDGAPWSQAVADVWGISLNILVNTLTFNAAEMSNVTNRYELFGGEMVFGSNTEAARLPNSSNTTGTQLTRLVTQALQGPDNACDIPDYPPEAEGAKDTEALY